MMSFLARRTIRGYVLATAIFVFGLAKLVVESLPMWPILVAVSVVAVVLSVLQLASVNSNGRAHGGAPELGTHQPTSPYEKLV